VTQSLCIAHGGDVSDPSGGTDRVSAIAGGLQSRGFDVSLVVPEPEETLPDELDDVSVHPVSTGAPVGGSLARAASVARAAKRVANQRGAQLQLEHSTFAGVATLLGISDFVLDIHDLGYARFDHVDTPFAPALKRGVHWLERRAAATASDIVVVSEYMRSALADWNVPPSTVSVVPNGFFPERIASARDVSTVEGRVCFLGTLHPKVDVEAFERIASLSSVSELVVVGDGALRDRVDSLAERHDSVRAPGRLPDNEAFELLASAAVAVNPQTQSELQRSSSPVKLYYYAALGLPMVVAPGPTVVEELVERHAAVAASGSEAVAEAVDGLLSDDEHRTNVGVNARDASEAFRWARRIDMFETIYRNTSEV